MTPNEDAPKPTAAPSPLAPGTRVRVRKGTRDPDYPDIPLGGWSGTITQQEESDDGRLSLVEWNDATLKQMHPVFRRRCERDGLEVERTWLSERDLEADPGGPAEVEQPGPLVPRPLDPGDQDDRVRAVFGLTSDDPLPAPDRERLAHYHRYLSERLHFPLDALYAETGAYVPGREQDVRFVGLTPLEQVREENGLLAEIERDGGRASVELFDVEVPRNDFVRQLLGDYSYWFTEAFRYAVAEPGRQHVRTGRGNEEEEERTAWPVAAVLLRAALFGCLGGGVVGAIALAVPGATLAMLIAGGLAAGVGYFLGSRLGFLLRALRLAERAPLLGGAFGGLGGAVLGAVVGPMLVAFPGTVLGSIFGYITGRTLAMLGVKRPGGFLGGALGAGIGGVVYAWLIDMDQAARGLIGGGVVGAVLGVVLVLLFLVSLMMFEVRQNDRQ
jgi:hypothetical protein